MNKKIPSCHSERPYHANGLCRSCYQKSYRARPGKRDRKHALEAAARARPENKLKKIASDKIYNARPEIKARAYALFHHLNYMEVLPWFQIEASSHRCWMCNEPGNQLHLDHDHATHKIRGWAHRQCNLTEGLVAASPDPRCLLATLALAYRLEGRE